ncbi:hypothetical protein KAFR_0J00430 [Kazachstania africana CBS 2517]|uniref:Uncharacterized protein n=1 Tax=Kazachstania africana (strain ATCC 22294 / BCRC 22015 / CBS 2517 / CECT 1963 / NBRC 1671 / NRRL Y-8276) TaxID=1071382 RepID=H2B0G1_KAZAF|nr:hypothetical protein KAFR_0J00430 [Kazachstania africana CBS 2517]CCF60111.1 hypothetical protein KAFR_0J00430 [Kazachstania africana CBS 2517]
MTNIILEVDLCLFDLDGTIVNTTIAAETAWTALCREHGVDPVELLKFSHGVRSGEVLKKFFPQIDNTDNKATIALEMTLSEKYVDTVRLVEGAKNLLLSLDKDTKHPGQTLKRSKWAIVTSGSANITHSWFNNVLKDVEKPEVFITAFDVKHGKPDPEGYTIARNKLCEIWQYEDVLNCKTVVFEDAPAGIQAGKALGAKTIGIATTFPKKKLFEAGADYVVQDLTYVTVIENSNNGNIVLQIKDPLKP